MEQLFYFILGAVCMMVAVFWLATRASRKQAERGIRDLPQAVADARKLQEQQAKLAEYMEGTWKNTLQ